MKFKNQKPSNLLAVTIGEVFVLIGIFLLGCVPQTQMIDGDPEGAGEVFRSPSPRPLQPDQPDGDGPSQQLATTFYKDVLPIFSRNEVGRFYKCTVCHSAYGKPEHVAKARVMDSIIDSIESGKMPPDQDRMRSEDLDVLKLWRRSGMQIGNPVPAPTGLDGVRGK